MYSIFQYGRMLTDTLRNQAYERALRQVVTSDSVVLDVGTGLGIFALLACKMGSRKVYAVEPDPIIRLAQEIAIANGYADRIVFIQDFSNKIDLPEKVDVLISDLRDLLPLHGANIPSVADARERFLSPGGSVIAQTDRIWVTLVTWNGYYATCQSPWHENDFGFDMHAGRKYVVNQSLKVRVDPEAILCPPQLWMEIDYTSITDPNAASTLNWQSSKCGVAHGLYVWFDTQLSEDITLSNAPTQPELIYGAAFFPLERPVPLELGEKISVTLSAVLTSIGYVWSWNTQVHDHAGTLKADFKQSTFLAERLERDSLHKRADTFHPHLSEQGLIDRLILDLMHQQKSLGDITKEIIECFPEHFRDWHEAFSRAADLSEHYSL